MSAPIFLTEEQLVTLIMQEMPQGVYPTDRADNPDPKRRSWSSAEIRAHARMFAQAYLTMAQIYGDKFVSTVSRSGLSSWESEFLGTVEDSTDSYQQRQSALFAQIRAAGGINQPSIENIVHGILDTVGLTFEIAPWNGLVNNGAWVLEESALEVGTYLSLMNPLKGQRLDLVPLDCDLDYAAAGLTLTQLQEIQRTAYTYELRIFGTAGSATLIQLDKSLTKYEPARSTHVIINNFINPP